MIRRAQPEDLYPLCDMAQRFIAESGLPYTYDPDLARDTFWEGINSGILIVDDQDGILSGAIMGYMGRDFCIEYTAYITKLYIEKEFRGSSIARELVKAFLKETEEAKLVFTSATAGMGERIEKLYVRLFERSGFNVLGRILVKEQL